MELGLSLGDHSSSSPREEPSNNILGLGFNTTLSIGPIKTTHKHQQQEEEETKPKQNNNLNNNNNNNNNNNKSQGNQDHNEATSEYPNNNNNNHVPQQLDLLPLLSLPWHPPSENGGLSSGRALNVNVLPVAAAAAAVEDEAEEGAALSSSPNSAASSFQMDLCIYSRGGSGGGGGGGGGGGSLSGSGGKRDSASDEDENGGGGDGNSTRKKLRLSKEQSAFLEESFKEHHTLNPKQKLALSRQLNLRPRQVEVWFQNRRARTKLKQTEVDCEYLKRCCETLTEENRRLHKELQELRALKTSNPFYMQLPATTLTMCPSCERVATNPTSNGANNVSNNNTNTPATTTANTSNNDSNSKAIGFPFGSKPRFHPFAHTSPQHLELN